MPALDKCPFCGSRKVVSGEFKTASQFTIYEQFKGKPRFGFKPNEVIDGFVPTTRNPWAFDVGPSAHFCGACNMVWSQADPVDASEFIRRWGTGALKARLDAQEP
jgi:hypothetical protein